jgi:malate dehydrogenase (oxaloacetate-decarboxylating)(NADP+)
MKIACAEALAALAREDVPDEVAMAYGRKLSFGRDYIIPTPFDPRLIYTIPTRGGACRDGYRRGASARSSIWTPMPRAPARMDPTSSILQGIYARARNAQARMIFAEGDDVRVLRAAVAYQRNGLGKALVVGREADVKAKLRARALAMRCGSWRSSTPPTPRISRATRLPLPTAAAEGVRPHRTFTALPRGTGTCFRR